MHDSPTEDYLSEEQINIYKFLSAQALVSAGKIYLVCALGVELI